MKCACSCSMSSVFGVLGVIGLGLAGFNTLRTGCPLGTCSDKVQAATVVPAADATAQKCPFACPESNQCPASACTQKSECAKACPAKTDEQPKAEPAPEIN